MTILTSAVVLFLIVSNVCVSYAEDSQLGIHIINPDDRGSVDALHLVYQTEETVTCMVTKSTTNPDVTFGFRNPDIINSTDISTTTIKKFVDNMYYINVTISFNVTGAMNHEYLACKFDGHEWTAYIDMYFRPLLLVYGNGVMPSTKDNKLEMHCDSISVPDTRIEWLVDDVLLDQTNITYTEKQECEQVYNTNYESKSNKYACRSNVILYNLTKENIGSKVQCAYKYLEEYYSRYIGVTSLDLYYGPDEVVLENKIVSAANESTNGLIEMTCTTSAANPKPKLYWSEEDDHWPRLNMSQYPVSVTNTSYNGHIVTQTVQTPVNKYMNGKTYYCCSDTSYMTADVCGSTDIQVSWLTSMTSPTLDEYNVYIGAELTIPCLVDSNPVSLIEWYKSDSKLIDNNKTHTNFLAFNLTKARKSDSGTYRCSAKLYVNGNNDPSQTISKSVNVNVRDLPPLPQVHVTEYNNKNAPSVTIVTPLEPSDVPQTFYLQYKKDSSTWWMEIDQSFRDSLPGQSETYSFDISKLGLSPGKYHLRIKSMSLEGLITYTDEQRFHVTSDEDDMVSKSSRTSAIIISVFVTAGVFLALIVVGVCLMKRRTCSTSTAP
ncbi:regulation of membrane permeability [Mactra antiquata]